MQNTLMTSSPILSVLNQQSLKAQEEKLAVDMKQYQIDMEKLFNNNQLIPRIRSEFTSAKFNFRKHMIDNHIDTDFGFDLLVQMVLHKRTTLPVLVGILRKHFKGHKRASQLTADLILRCVEADLVDWSPGLEQFILRFDISEDVQNELDRYQYPLPMIVHPKKINSNEDTGYFTSTNSVILKYNNHHEEDVCLEHLNKMNDIQLRINSETAVMIKNSWRNLDKPKDGEDRKDYIKRLKAFEKYDRTAFDVMAHLEISGNVFWLTHKYDKRGRVYAQGYHINYQGNAWNKAVIEFANGELVNG